MKKKLLAIVEYGGYPDFSPLYRQLGYETERVTSVRKAIQYLKKVKPEVIVAEFNFQSDFRDRTSSLESLLAVTQRSPDIKVILFYDAEYRQQFARLHDRFAIHEALTFPIDEEKLRQALA